MADNQPTRRFKFFGWDEIEKSPALVFYGALLSLIHTATFVHWWKSGWPLTLASGTAPICQPFFQSCDRVQIFSEPTLNLILWLYGAYSLFTASIFILAAREMAPPVSSDPTLASLPKFRVRTALIHLTILTVLKFGMFSLSFMFMGNYHYMPFIITALYLFWPSKRMIIPLMLCAFYFGAGLLKLNREWLSGSALLPQQVAFLGRFWLHAACAFVIGLELLLVWGLLAKERSVRYTTLFVLTCFHLFSYVIVGFFYPVVMFLLLAWFLVHDSQPLRVARQKAWLFLPIALFLISQGTPWLYPGDPALTGEGRALSLNMFDARAQCRSLINTHWSGNSTKEYTPSFKNLGARVKCDPYVYFEYAKNLCKNLKPEARFQDLDLYLENKRTSDPEFKMRISERNFCAANLNYSILQSNAWIHK